MSIQLTPELESALAEEARRRGTTPDLLAQAYLWERLDSPDNGVDEGEGTLADFLEGYAGVLSFEDEPGRGSRLSEDTGRRFGELLSRRQANGRP